ncbi:MAG: glycosyltransferase [Anaerolineales bacterium]|nr:glycosyltransferase [Anaerolineales bacterium]
MKTPLLKKITMFYRHFWNVYQLEERSQAVTLTTIIPLEFARLPVSVILCYQGTLESAQSALNALKSQLDQDEDEILLICDQGSAGEKLNTVIQSVKNSLLVIASSNMIPHKNWLKLMADAMLANPDSGFALGKINVHGAGRSYVLAHHASKLEYLSGDLMLLRKQAWARAGGFPANADVDKARKIFNLRLQNTNHSHLIVETAVADSIGTGQNIFMQAFRSAYGEGGLGLFAPVIWKQLGFMLLFSMLIFVSGALLFWRPTFGVTLLLLGLVVLPILKGWRMSFETADSFPLGVTGSLSTGWIQIIRWIGYVVGVFSRTEERILLDLEAGRALSGIISQHPNRAGVVIFSPTVDWTYMFQRYQQMARQFARKNYLVFYHTDNLRSDAFVGFQEVEPMLFVTPAPLETFGELSAPIFYVNSPWLAPMIPWLKNPVVIYDHCDDILVSAGQAQDHDELLRHSHLTLASSNKLLMEDQAVRENTLLLPNAVDFDWVAQNAPKTGEVAPEDLQKIINKKKPIIGYTGALAEWFDYELLIEVCEQCPEMEFVLIGIDYDHSLGQTRLLECENVTWLGHKPYQALFQYVWRFDVAIIPFCVNQITLATSPVKLFEYFACQKPVVSTALPECEKYEAVFIAHDAAEFRAQLHKALAAIDSEKYIEQLIEIARQNTWEARVGRIIKELSDGGRVEL